MIRRFYIIIAVLFVFPFHVFSQQQSTSSAGGLRNYVGLINQSYHPGIVAIFEKAKAEYARRGNNDAVRAIDIFLNGAFGSGFVYSDARGNLYVLTNNHVVSQAHTLSITFESQDGTKTKIENLRIIATDEEADLAILIFPEGEKPVTQGLSFITNPVDEGDDVYSAGFPGLGITPIWQFGRGMVSNASARFPRSLDDETLMGPYIQHTAQIDAGNSGGPLLVAQLNVPSGYAVAGMNTLSGLRRQAANYAIPANRIQPFINNALNPRPETFRDELDQRLAKFTEGLGENKAVFPHIAEFLSTVCIGENAQYAMDEMYSKANSAAKRILDEKASESIVGALGYAVAWTIENSVRRQGTTINASVKEVSGEGEEYTVVFTINNKDVSSVWIREYGNWRIRSFGDVATGDQSTLQRRQSQREASEKLKMDGIQIEDGFATLFEKAPAAFYISLDTSTFGAKMYFVSSELYSFGVFSGIRFGIPAGNFGFIPYLRIGFDYQYDKEFINSIYNEFMSLPISVMGQVGLKVTTSYVPGLFVGVGFQYNIFSFHTLSFFDEPAYSNPIKAGLSFTAGYTF
jgi:serine protease Do